MPLLPTLPRTNVLNGALFRLYIKKTVFKFLYIRMFNILVARVSSSNHPKQYNSKLNQYARISMV